ncbi:MAG: hypothetical protein MJ239_03360 [Bacilli bacterium]|nr:hypothetical protein [Bacilli bacterium]
MKSLRSIILGSLAFLLSLGGATLLCSNNTPSSAKAASGFQTEYNAVFFHNTNINGGVPFSYVNSDNPPASTQTIDIEDMHTLADEFTVSSGYTTGGTTNLTINEPVSTKKFTAIYIPIIVYAQALPNGYSFGNPTITFTVNHSGWDEDNFSNATMFYHGTGARSGESSAYYTFFRSPNGNGAALGNSIWYVGDPSKTTTTQTHSIDSAVYQNINADGKTHNTIVGFYSLYLYARKDSSSSHQLSFSLSAKIKFDESVSYEVAASNSTKGYKDLYQAFADSTGNKTIKVWRDLSVTTSLSVFGSQEDPKNLILDLNGKTVTMSATLTIYNWNSLVIKNGNIEFIGFNYNSGLISNRGTLTIESDVNVSIKSPNVKNLLLTNESTGVVTIGAATLTPSSVDRAIYNSGVMNLNGTKIAAPSYSLFTAIENDGQLYLGGNCVIKNITQSQLGIIYGKYGSTSYSGAKIDVKLDSTVTSGITVASQIASGKLSFTFAVYSNRYIVNYSSKNLSYVTNYRYYDVNFNITGCTAGAQTPSYRYGESLTVTISPLSGYQVPNTISVTSNGASLNAGYDYTYDKTTGIFTLKGSYDCFAAIAVSGEGIDISPETKLKTWAASYLHLDYTSNEGYCKDSTHHYYTTAKTKLLALGEEVVITLKTSSDETIVSYRARYEAWARANNDLEYAYSDDFTHISASANNIELMSSSNALPIVMTLVVSSGAISLIAFAIFKGKRRHEK